MSKSSSSYLLLTVCAMTLTSCETTGDPTQGGLFGWSQPKANERIYQKQRELSHLEGDNYRQQQRTGSLKSQRDRLDNQ